MRFFKQRKSEQELRLEFLEAKDDIYRLKIQKDTLKQTLGLEKEKQQRDYERRITDINHSAKLKEESRDNAIANMKASLLVKHEQDIAKIKAEYSNKLVEEKDRLNKEFYGKMTKTLQEVHAKGNHTTDFLKDMTLKMLDRSPSMRVDYKEETSNEA